MAYNFQLHSLAVFEWDLNKPINEGGIVARHRAEVWRVRDGQATELAEIWFASEIPGGTNFVKFILDLI
jgi:hypothetical protein